MKKDNFKSVKRYFLSLLFALIAFSGALFGQEGDSTSNVATQSDKKVPTIEASLSRDTIVIGDQITLTLNVAKDVAQMVVLPEVTTKATDGAIEVLSNGGVDTLSHEGRDVKIKVDYTITSFEAGRYTINPFPMLVVEKNATDTIYSDSLHLFVDTYVIDTATYVVHDIKEPMDTPFTFDEFLYYLKEVAISPYSYLVLLLIALIVFVTWYITGKKGKKEENKPQIPPHIIAMGELQQLKSEELLKNGKHKRYYTRLSDILRVYLDGRYGVMAMEMTSDDILEALKAINLSVSDYEKVKEFLAISDFVKFAKLIPADSESEDAFNYIYQFVEQTKLLPSQVEQNLSEDEKETK